MRMEIGLGSMRMDSFDTMAGLLEIALLEAGARALPAPQGCRV